MDDSWDWNVVRFELFNALDQFEVHDIFFIEKENRIVSISIILEDVDKIRPLQRMNIVDKLIADKAPELYRQYVFCYEIWSKPEWDQLPVRKFFDRLRPMLKS